MRHSGLYPQWRQYRHCQPMHRMPEQWKSESNVHCHGYRYAFAGVLMFAIASFEGNAISNTIHQIPESYRYVRVSRRICARSGCNIHSFSFMDYFSSHGLTLFMMIQPRIQVLFVLLPAVCIMTAQLAQALLRSEQHTRFSELL